MSEELRERCIAKLLPARFTVNKGALGQPTFDLGGSVPMIVDAILTEIGNTHVLVSLDFLERHPWVADGLAIGSEEQS